LTNQDVGPDRASRDSTDAERPGKRQEGRHGRGCLKIEAT